MTLSAKEKVERIRQAYYDPKMGLVSGDRLYRKLRSQGITRKDINHFLEKQQVSQMHHQSKKPTYYPIYSLMDAMIDYIIHFALTGNILEVQYSKYCYMYLNILSNRA